MASLSPPFILCPLPDRKALLGIQPDCLQNKAVVTLNKNIAIRYYVQEQKQERSWTTSKYWFTSPVSYCYDFGKYGAVLNHNYVALWDDDDSALERVSKTKLPEGIFGLHSNPNGRTIVVMKNGHVSYLNTLLQNKNVVKTAVIDPKETLLSFEFDESSNTCYLISKVKDEEKFWVSSVSIENDLNNVINRFSFGEKDQSVLGYRLVTGFGGYVVFLGSDGYIYKTKLHKEDNQPDVMKLTNFTKYVSNRNPVIICSLQNNFVAVYGSDPSEEGAVVVIYDIHYDLVVSKQSLKLYSTPPLMHKIDQSLFVPLGLHILVLGFRITKSLLSSVVGKHQAKLNEEVFEGRNPWKTSGWNVDKSTKRMSKSNLTAQLESIKLAYPAFWEIIHQVKILENEGQPEAVICNHVVPVALEQNNGPALDWILDTFSDIPEIHIVNMVAFSLKTMTITENSDEENIQLNRLLVRKFDKDLLASNLKNISHDDTKKLLYYIISRMKNHWQLKNDFDEGGPMKYWLKWVVSILDSNYTKFVLHSESKVIDSLLEIVCECSKVMESVAEIEPYLIYTTSKTSFEANPPSVKKWRTETVTFV